MWSRCSNGVMRLGATAQHGRAAAACILAMLLSACGSSGPVQPDVATDEDVLANVVSPAAEADFAAALAAMTSDDLVEAELRLEQFVLEYPHFPGAYVNLAILYARDDRLDEARQALDEALALDPLHASANHQLGILLRQRGQFAAAEQAYQRALATAPDFALAHRNFGILLDVYLQRPAEALQHYRRYQELVAEPDAIVGRWIIDLERRVGADGDADTARVAQGEGA